MNTQNKKKDLKKIFLKKRTIRNLPSQSEEAEGLLYVMGEQHGAAHPQVELEQA